MRSLTTLPIQQSNSPAPSTEKQLDPRPREHTSADENEKINPFICAANPLLSLITQLKRSQKPNDIDQLRKQIIGEIKLFEQKMFQLNYTERVVHAARYCLCTAIDESILKTDWGTQTVWVQHSLLSYFHHETWGGERFYLILDQMSQEPRRHLALLELLYLLLSLGFEGKFFDKGVVIREEIRNRMMHVIKHATGKPARTLSFNIKDTQALLVKKQKKSSLKWIAIATGVLLLIINVCFNLSLSSHARSTINSLNKIGNESAITAYSQLINRSIVSHSNPSGVQLDRTISTH